MSASSEARSAEESKVEQPRTAEISPLRAQFDSALRVLLIRENLDGAEWAIRQIQEAADTEKDDVAHDALVSTVHRLQGMLDKRTAELATKEH